MKGNRNILLAATAAHAAAYAANTGGHITGLDAVSIVDGARARHQTIKQMAKMRGRGLNGETIFVPSRKWVDRSSYRPHQGKQEMARRVRQGVVS